MADLTAGHLLATGVLAALVRARDDRRGPPRRGVAARRRARRADPGSRLARRRGRRGGATRDARPTSARADEIAGGLAMNPYYRCFEAADGFLAVACLNLPQRRAFLALFGLDDPTIEAPDLVPEEPPCSAAKQVVTAAVERASRPSRWKPGSRGSAPPACRPGRCSCASRCTPTRRCGRTGSSQEVEQPGLGRVADARRRLPRRRRGPAGCGPAPALGADTAAVLREVGT